MDIYDLTFKRDEVFENIHLYLSKNGVLYMSEDFAKFLVGHVYNF